MIKISNVNVQLTTFTRMQRIAATFCCVRKSIRQTHGSLGRMDGLFPDVSYSFGPQNVLKVFFGSRCLKHVVVQCALYDSRHKTR